VQAVLEFFGGVFVAAQGSRKALPRGLEDHPQQPGGLANAGRGGKQRQAAWPERETGKCPEELIRLWVANRCDAHNAYGTGFQRGVWRRCPRRSPGADAGPAFVLKTNIIFSLRKKSPS